MGNKKLNINTKMTRIPTPKQMMVLELAILMMMKGIEPTAKKLYDFMVLKNKQNPDIIVPVAFPTLAKWFQHEKFRNWFDKAIADRIRKNMNIDARNVVFVDKMWKEAMKAEPNMAAANLYARIAGLLQEQTNINIDNRQQTINGNPITNIPSIEDLETGKIVISEKEENLKKLPLKEDGGNGQLLTEE